MKKVAMLLGLLSGFLCACSPTHSDLKSTATRIALNIVASQTAVAAVPTSTHTLTPTPSVGPSLTPTRTPTSTPTPTSMRTPTPSRTPTVTRTPTPTSTSTPTPKPAGPAPAPAATRTPSPSAGLLTGRIALAVYNAGLRSYTLYIVTPDGSNLHAIADYVHQPDFAPGGVRIAVNGFGGGKEDLWDIKADGSDWHKLTSHPDDFFPTWAPDGSHVVFSSTRQGDGVHRLYTDSGPLGSSTTKFIIGNYPVWLPTWEVAFSGCDYGWGTDTRCGTWRVTAGHVPQQITDNPQDIPLDGAAGELLFLRSEAGNWDIYRIPLGGGTPTRLTDHPGRDGPATFSPDGKTIAFLSTRSGAWALYTMDRQGASVEKRLDLPMGGDYDASPLPWTDGRISWGVSPASPLPAPTAAQTGLLPAPQILFPSPNDTVSSSRPTAVRWTWSRTLAFNQGFEVRFWHSKDPGPMAVAPPTEKMELEVNFGFTESFQRHKDDVYFLDAVVVQLNPYQVLSKGTPVQVWTDPNK